MRCWTSARPTTSCTPWAMRATISGLVFAGAAMPNQFAVSMIRELDARRIDFVVSRMYDPPSEEHLAEVLFEDPLVVVTGANNPLARRRRIGLPDLVRQPW